MMKTIAYSGGLPSMLRRGTVAALVAVGASGCFFDQGPPRREVVVESTSPWSSTLVVRWTISGTKNPDECVKANASELEVSVTAPSGRELGAWRQQCDDFALSIGLRPGSYAAHAVLLRSDGRPRTTTVNIEQFVLRGNDTLEVPIDFPASSFLQQ